MPNLPETTVGPIMVAPTTGSTVSHLKLTMVTITISVLLAISIGVGVGILISIVESTDSDKIFIT